MTLLNGKHVDPKEIDPAKHKFIGLFREPTPPYRRPGETWEVMICECGMQLWTVNSIFEHWQLGHMDTPQYVDI